MLTKGTLIYYTATNLYWKPLMEENSYKDIVVRSLQFLVKNKELILYGFVIMPNHMHLLLQVPETIPSEKDVQHSLMSFTAHEFKKHLIKVEAGKLEEYYVGDADRKYQFWERNPLPVNVFSKEMAEQKLDYIHLNPLQEKWNLATEPENYYYSSAKFYQTGIDDFGMLTHYMEYFGN
jgi:putative transposase